MYHEVCGQVGPDKDLLNRFTLIAKGTKHLIPKMNEEICGMWNKRFSLFMKGCCPGNLAIHTIQKNVPKAIILTLANYETLLSFNEQLNFLISCPVTNSTFYIFYSLIISIIFMTLESKSDGERGDQSHCTHAYGL